MQTIVLDGRKIADEIVEELKFKSQAQEKKLGRKPYLVSVLVGEDCASKVYMKSQMKLAQRLNIEFELKELPQNISQSALEEDIENLCLKNTVDGIIIQMPLPAHLDSRKVVAGLDPRKDAEGLHHENLGRLFFPEAKIIPPTAASVMALLEDTKIDLYGKEIVIVGHSEIVGKPLSLLLLNKFATTTVCHIGTSRAGLLESHLSRAEILIVAVGKPHFIKGSSLKDGVIVIDVGINKLAGKVVGDVDFEGVRDKASFITPVPGGVGSLTPAMLMRNFLNLVEMRNGNCVEE